MTIANMNHPITDHVILGIPERALPDLAAFIIWLRDFLALGKFAADPLTGFGTALLGLCSFNRREASLLALLAFFFRPAMFRLTFCTKSTVT